MDKSPSVFNNTSPDYICPWCNTHGKYIEEYLIDCETQKIIAKKIYLVAKCLKCADNEYNCTCDETPKTICRKHSNIFKIVIGFDSRFNEYKIHAPNDLLLKKQLPNIVRLSKFICNFSQTQFIQSGRVDFIIPKTIKPKVTPIKKFIENSIQKVIDNYIPKLILIHHVLIKYDSLPPEITNIIFQLLGKELWGIIPFESINTIYEFTQNHDTLVYLFANAPIHKNIEMSNRLSYS